MKRPKYLHLLYLLLGCLCALVESRADNYYGLPNRLSPQSQISILIAEPSPLHIYTLYGHAGYRISDPSVGLDVTFNYGIFDFSDDFLIRFVQGRTDYIVVPQPTADYMSEYLGRGSQITEIVLALDPEAKAKVWAYLLWNVEPENRVYRYNFFYDNCSTRLVEITAKAMAQDTIQSDSLGHRYRSVRHLALPGDRSVQNLPFVPKPAPDLAHTTTSWRTQINQLEARSPWLVLGTDLALGAPTDETMRESELIFLPHLLPDVLRRTASISYEQDIVGDSIRNPRYIVGNIIERIEVYGDKSDLSTSSWYEMLYHPSLVFAIICLCALYVAYTSRYRWFAPCLFALSGLGGLVIAYIAFLSEHPHVAPNYNLIILCPLHLLLGFPLMLSCHTRRLSSIYHGCNVMLQSFFLITCPPFGYSLLPQSFHPAVYWLSISLLALSISHIRASVLRVDKQG